MSLDFYVTRMRRAAPVAAFVLSLSCGIRDGLAQASNAVEDIIALEEQSWKHFKAKNYKAMRALWDKDVIIIATHGVINADQMVAMMTRNSCDIQSVRLEHPNVTRVTPTVAFVTYRAIVVGTCGGERISPEATFNSNVWVKRDAAWLMALLHETPDLAGS